MKYVEHREAPPAKSTTAYRAAMATGHKPSGQSMQSMAFATLGGPKKAALDYGVGDKVAHVKFGTGVVKSIVDGGRDYDVSFVLTNE